MPILGQVVSGGKLRQRVDANNKIKIPDGARPAEIVDIWIFNVDENGKYTREKTNEQKVSIKVRFEKRPDIVLEKRLRCYISAKSMFAQLVGRLARLEPGSDAMRAYNTDNLIGKKVMVETKYNPESGYTNIETITSAPVSDDAFDEVPPQTMAAVQKRNDDEYDFPDERF